jgi:hypothetical protein
MTLRRTEIVSPDMQIKGPIPLARKGELIRASLLVYARHREGVRLDILERAPVDESEPKLEPRSGRGRVVVHVRKCEAKATQLAGNGGLALDALSDDSRLRQQRRH